MSKQELLKKETEDKSESEVVKKDVEGLVYKKDSSFCEEYPKALIAKMNEDNLPVIACEAKSNNPNYYSIIGANDKFCEAFALQQHNLIGKSYDFLFSDLDLDYSSEDHAEYIRLIKSAKDFKECSIIIGIFLYKKSKEKKRFKVSFIPDEESSNDKLHFALLSFEKLESKEEDDQGQEQNKTQSLILLKNLERSLRKERLLREVGNLIISDKPIADVAEEIARLICQHLRADRCLIHDYRDSQTSFVVEYDVQNGKKILDSDNSLESQKMLAQYINFQNHFFERYGDSSKQSNVIAISDVAGDKNFEKIKSLCEKYSIKSQVSATTIFNNKVNGGIYIHQSNRRNWVADEIELIEMIADQFSIAIDRSESIEKVMITNHALMEKTLQLKESLKQEQEMRQMQSEFVALVSHEFKTPLQIIDSTRELVVRKIKKSDFKDPLVEKGFDRIKQAISRMNGLIHSTLNLAKMESGGDNKIKVQSQDFDLKKFIFDIIEKNAELAKNKNIKVLTNLNDLPTSFNGDPKLLDHAFTNIISNAIKYSKDNSTVKILAKANDKKVLIRVIDQGIGIPKDDLAKIGQKFFRAKNTLAVAGTGIGLYLTKHFIELHKGSLKIDSEVNVGSSFTAMLPKNVKY